jgi:hypothetical protein
MGVGDLADSTQLAAVHVKAADAYGISVMATAIHVESDLSEVPGEATIVDQPEELDDGGEDAVLEQEEPQAAEEAAPPPEAPQPAAPTAEERQEAERERDRKRFEARRAGRMYFVRHPRAPEDPGTPGRSAPARRPLVRARAGAQHAWGAGELHTKGLEHELETYQVQTRVLNESINLKKARTLRCCCCPASRTGLLRLRCWGRITAIVGAWLAGSCQSAPLPPPFGLLCQPWKGRPAFVKPTAAALS